MVDVGSASIGLGSSVKWGSIGNTLLIFLIMIVVLVVSGIFIFMMNNKKRQKKEFKNKIIIFKDFNGQRIRIGEDLAKEVFIPDTNISVFYLKERKMYMPKPTRLVGRDESWYCILSNGEWLNFNLGKFDAEEKSSLPGYDHRDTRYAYLNLKELIKRNYRDKSVKWWKEYFPLITFIVMAFIFTLGCFVLISKMNSTIAGLNSAQAQWSSIAESLRLTVDAIIDINSGVVKVG